MDQAEVIVARKRLERWPDAWKADLLRMPKPEQMIVGELIALLDARPVDEGETTE